MKPRAGGLSRWPSATSTDGENLSGLFSRVTIIVTSARISRLSAARATSRSTVPRVDSWIRRPSRRISAGVRTSASGGRLCTPRPSRSAAVSAAMSALGAAAGRPPGRRPQRLRRHSAAAAMPVRRRSCAPAAAPADAPRRRRRRHRRRHRRRLRARRRAPREPAGATGAAGAGAPKSSERSSSRRGWRRRPAPGRRRAAG